MRRLLQTYGTLCFSLLALFASGIFIGRMTSTQVSKPTAAKVDPATVSDAWVVSASRSLVEDLKLDENQRGKLRAQLEPVAEAIFSDRERALFQMHLRLLEFHDQLAKNTAMTDVQLKRLASSRAKLKNLIITNYPNMVRENPSLVVKK